MPKITFNMLDLWSFY